MNFAINPATKGLGSSFKGVTAYLMTDKDRGDQGEGAGDRVGFVLTQNLPTDDAGQAWRIMARTAQDREELKAAVGGSRAGRKPREVKPVFHYALSWHPNQKPTAEHMRETALASLKALGLEQYQALIVQHTDEDRAHLHVVVNRVHPETGKLDTLSNNQRKLDRWADRYEVETGQIVSPDRRAKFEALEQGRQQTRKTKEKLPHSLHEQTRPAVQAKRRENYREASGALYERQLQERADFLSSAKLAARQLAVDTRAEQREKWSQLGKRQARERFEMKNALESRNPGRVAKFINDNRASLLEGYRTKEEARQKFAEVLKPRGLQRRMSLAHRTQTARLSNETTQTMHDAQRAFWASYRDQSDALRQRQADERAELRENHGIKPGPSDRAKPERDLAAAADRIERGRRLGRPANDAPGSPSERQPFKWGALALGIGAIGVAALSQRRDRATAGPAPTPDRGPATPVAHEPVAPVPAPKPKPTPAPIPANESRPPDRVVAAKPAPAPDRPSKDRTPPAKEATVSERIAIARARNAARRRDPNRFINRERERD